MKYLLALVILLSLSISCSDDCPVCPRNAVSNRCWYIKADGTGDAPTIQAGIDSAAAGDTVLVAPGFYDDTTHVHIDQELKAVNVYLHKSVKLLAEGAPFNTIINGNYSDIAIYVEGVSSAGEIRGFAINTEFEDFACVDAGFASKTEAQTLDHTAIYCKDSQVRINGNEIEDNNYAIYLRHSPVVIANNIIHRAMGGIVCDAESHATIRNNSLDECGSAVFSYDLSSHPDVVDNSFFGGCGGVYTGGSLVAGNDFLSIDVVAVQARDGAVVEGNLFGGVPEAIRLGDSVLVRNNLFYNIGTAIQYFGGGSVVEHNTVDNAGSFIFARSAGSLTFMNNIVSRSNSGISAPVDTYIIECNNLYDIAYEKYGWELSDRTGIDGNVSVDPKFCYADPLDHTLSSDSPCAPGNHPDGYDCGLIGAFPVRCLVASMR